MQPTKELPALICLLLLAPAALASPCVLPDNGTGTIDLPPECPDGYQGFMQILDGLPPGSTLDIDATLSDLTSIVRFPGGSLGGEVQQFDAILHWEVTGTGDLAGFNRTLGISVQCEFHSAPRTPGSPLQAFDCGVFRLYGQHFGDPDFCELIVSAGSDLGLPSPGQTTLTELPSGDYAVDSFFDISYRIDFQGCPGSMLEDLAGSTVDTQRFRAGELYPTHSCVLPDNGTGTTDLPPECPDGYRGFMQILDGLPPGSTLDIDATLSDFTSIVRFAGGSLGGEVQQFDAILHWEVTGTGDLAGFNRTLGIHVQCEFHSAPRTPGDPLQVFDCGVFRLFGQHFGDPDFCELIVSAGSDLGLSSPGQTTLTELPSGDFAVDSFFDISYRIDFQGCPGSRLEDLAGSTLDTQRFRAGEPYTTGIAEAPRAGQVALYQNVPNPFNPTTTIRYDIPDAGGWVRLEIYDVRGRSVRTLVSERQAAGRRSVMWDGRNQFGRRVPSGVYLYVLRIDGNEAIKKLAIIR
jgi:hypothetical protein